MFWLQQKAVLNVPLCTAHISDTHVRQESLRGWGGGGGGKLRPWSTIYMERTLLTAGDRLAKARANSLFCILHLTYFVNKFS